MPRQCVQQPSQIETRELLNDPQQIKSIPNSNRSSRVDRFTTETKEATKTTELIAFVAAVVGVDVTAFTVDEDPNFGAERAWLYITILTVGYMISRGLAKAGNHEPYDDGDG